MIDINTFNFIDNLTKSQHVLEYSLYLDLPKGSFNTKPTIAAHNTEWLKDVSQRVFECCKIFMNGGSPQFWGTIDLAKNLAQNGENVLNNQNDLSILLSADHFESSWQLMLQHHGIISAFVKLRKLIGNSNQLTAYRALLYTHFLTQYKDFGLDYLIHNEYLNIEAKNNALSIKKASKAPTDEERDFGNSLCSEYLRKTASHYMNSLVRLSKSIPALSDLEIGTFKLLQTEELKQNGKYRIPAHFLEFNHLLRKNSKYLKHIFSNYKPENNSFTKRKYINYLHCCIELLKNIDSCELCFSNSDRLYVKYQFEHYFNLNMIDCLFQNIQHARTTLNYDMTTQADLNILSSCLLLPNTFSRHYLVQMAFDILKHDYLYEESFFFKLKNESDAVVTKLNSAKDILGQSNKLSSWRDLYQRFIRYLTRFYFPVYENIFFVLLYNDLKLSYPEKRDEELLTDLYLILSKYLSQENIYNEILSMDTKIVEFEMSKNVLRKDQYLKEFIIQPKFNSSDSPDHGTAALYGRCLMAAYNQPRPASTPDFISLDYLKSLVNKPDEKIRAYYVIGSSAPKET